MKDTHRYKQYLYHINGVDSENLDRIVVDKKMESIESYRERYVLDINTKVITRISSFSLCNEEMSLVIECKLEDE